MAATRIADVASRAGTSPPAVLYWFEDRDELINEALGFSEDRFYDSVTVRLSELGSPGKRLRLSISFVNAQTQMSRNDHHLPNGKLDSG